MGLAITRSDLENILPREWGKEIFTERGITKFNVYEYASMCRRFFAIESYLQNEFNETPHSVTFFEKNKERIFSLLKKIDDTIGQKVSVSSTFGQDYETLIDTTNELIKNNLREERKFRSEDIIDHNTWGIHAYAPTISFLKKRFNNELSGKSILDIGARAYGIAALSYLNFLGADVHGLDAFYKPSKDVLKNNNIDYITNRWEYIGKIFKPESLDVIYTNYMYPSPYEGGPFCEEYNCSNSIRLNIFESHIAKEMYKLLKPNGMYILHNWGYNEKNEYLYFNRDNFSQYDLNTYPIESLGEPKRINITTRTELTEGDKKILSKYDIPASGLRAYPLNPKDKDMYFGTKLIVFQKKV